MQIVSAYLLAASTVDDGNYDEDYDMYIDPEFEEYMELGGADIVGDYIELSTPTGGTQEGNFDGSKFCSDWLSAFTLPLEYAQIFANKGGYQIQFPSTGDASQWADYTVPFDWQTEQITEQLIPKWLDDDVYANTGHHINLWFVTTTLLGNTQYPNTNGYGLAGVYLPSNIGWKIKANYPAQGYGVFEMSDAVYKSTYTASRTGHTESGNGIAKRYTNEGWKVGGTGTITQFVMVYNPDAFKRYLNGLDAATINQILNNTAFILAECNISKSRI